MNINAVLTNHDWAKRLLDRHESAVLNVGKYGGLHVKAGHIALLPTEEQPRSLLHPDLAIFD